MNHLTPERIEALAAASKADAHLASCSRCAEAVTSARGRQQLLKGMTPHTLGDMAFRRVEARLNEALEQGLPAEPFRWGWLLWSAPVALALALALGAVLVLSSPGQPEPPAQARPPTLVAAKSPWQSMLVAMASGDAQMRPGHEAWAPLTAGAVLDQNVAVAGSRVLLTAAGWALEASGSVALGGPATIALGAGTLSARADHAPIVVVAGGVRISAEESAFFISRSAAEVVVDVFQGQVDVGSSVERLKVTGPARVRWSEGSALRTEALVGSPPQLSVPAEPWVRFDVSELARGTVLDIDGQRVGITPLSLLLAAGRHRVQVTPKGQPTRESWVDLIGRQTAVFRMPSSVAMAPKPEDSPEVDPAALARVLEDLKRQTPKLRACYEKWLKANPMASGEVDLVLQVSATGQVTRASVKGTPISRESADCLTLTARSLVLSPLGSMQELEVPLVLTPRSR